MQLFKVSFSPHDHTEESVSKLMFGVIISLVPAFVASLIAFGPAVLVITATAMISCAAFEYLIQKYLLRQKPAISDGSALVTGILMSFCLPSNIPVWLVILGSFVAIAVGKMSFGGLGNNPFNPALVGRVFLFVSFPAQLTSWPEPLRSWSACLDATTGATPLAIMKEGLQNGEPVGTILAELPSYTEMLMGRTGGSLGEMAAFALLIGLGYMLYKRIITWHIPVSIIMTVILFTGILWLSDPESNADPLFHLLSGGLLLGAIYMATDYVTSPMNPAGMIVYGTGIGIITVVIRLFGTYPEGVQFAILTMNASVPLINKYMKPARYGEAVE